MKPSNRLLTRSPSHNSLQLFYPIYLYDFIQRLHLDHLRPLHPPTPIRIRKLPSTRRGRMLPLIIHHYNPRLCIRILCKDPLHGIVGGFLGGKPAAQALHGLVAGEEAHHDVAVAGGAAAADGGVDVRAAARDGAVADTAGDLVGGAVGGCAGGHGGGGVDGDEREGVVGRLLRLRLRVGIRVTL